MHVTALMKGGPAKEPTDDASDDLQRANRTKHVDALMHTFDAGATAREVAMNAGMYVPKSLTPTFPLLPCPPSTCPCLPRQPWTLYCSTFGSNIV